MKIRRDQNRVDSFRLKAGKELISSEATRRDDEWTCLTQLREDLPLARRITEPDRQTERWRDDLGWIELHDPVESA
jgi:hypothetical protein